MIKTKLIGFVVAVALISIGVVIYGIIFPGVEKHQIKLPIYDMNKILDSKTLKQQIIQDTTVTVDGKKIRTLKIKFFAMKWQDVDIFETVGVLIPEVINPIYKGKAVIMQSGSLNMDPGLDIEKDFAAATAVTLGIPVLVGSLNVPPEPFGYKREEELSQAFRHKIKNEGDLTLEVLYPLAVIYMRAMTLMENLDQAGKPSEFVTTGSSKRGSAQWIIAQKDIRVKGFMPNAFNAIDMGNYWDLIESEFGGNSMFGTTADWVDWMESPTGIAYRKEFDPEIYYTEKQKKFIMNIGTNDNFYPVQSGNGFMDKKNNGVFALIDNYPHGWGSQKHLGNLRAIIQRTFDNRKSPVVEVSSSDAEENQIKVTAKINNTEKINSVKIYYSTDFNNISDNLKVVNSTWKSVSMTNSNNAYVGYIPSSSIKLGYYVEIEDEFKGEKAYTTSKVIIKK